MKRTNTLSILFALKNNVDTKGKAFLSSSLFYVALVNSKEIDKQLHPCTCWWLRTEQNARQPNNLSKWLKKQR